MENNYTHPAEFAVDRIAGYMKQIMRENRNRALDIRQVFGMALEAVTCTVAERWPDAQADEAKRPAP